MKSDEQYCLETAVKNLEISVRSLRVELNKLDPLVAAEARFKLAEIEGVLAYMQGRYEEITRKS